LSVILFSIFQNRNIVPAFDGTNYGYWKARMHFFLKCIDCWQIVEFGWAKLEDTTLELIPTRNARLANDKALHALCQVLSLSEFAKISNCEIAQEAWQILETTYEGTKLVKSA
jgi:D-lyxose ketol-isomerase